MTADALRTPENESDLIRRPLSLCTFKSTNHRILDSVLSMKISFSTCRRKRKFRSGHYQSLNRNSLVEYYTYLILHLSANDSH